MFYCCLSNAEKVNIVISHFGPLNRLNQIEKSDYPQFLCGRILPVEKSLQGPISGKECVYYEAVVERLEDKTDDNGLIGIPDSEDSLKVWVPLFYEKKSADFVLMDPSFPSASLYVPGSVIRVKVMVTEDTSIKAANTLTPAKRAKVTVHHNQLPPYTEEFLKRGGVTLGAENNASTKDKKIIYRYRESSFEKGEQVAVLGLIREIRDEAGTPFHVVKEVSKEILTNEFFQAKGFSEWEKNSWLDLTEQPCVIITDMPKYFQKLEIPPLSNILAHARYLDVGIASGEVEPKAMQRS